MVAYAASSNVGSVVSVITSGAGSLISQTAFVQGAGSLISQTAFVQGAGSLVSQTAFIQGGGGVVSQTAFIQGADSLVLQTAFTQEAGSLVSRTGDPQAILTTIDSYTVANNAPSTFITANGTPTDARGIVTGVPQSYHFVASPSIS